MYFNSHPHEEDDITEKGEITHGNNFNSHPHEEDDLAEVKSAVDEFISTHILTKRMTSTGAQLANLPNKFQLTSSRRG